MLVEQIECEDLTELGEQMLETAHRVYRKLGPEHSREAYLNAFCRELELREVPCQRDVWLPEILHGCTLNVGDVAHVFASNCVVITVIAAREISEEDERRLTALLSRSKRPLGYLINCSAHKAELFSRKVYYNPQSLQEE